MLNNEYIMSARKNILVQLNGNELRALKKIEDKLVSYISTPNCGNCFTIKTKDINGDLSDMVLHYLRLSGVLISDSTTTCIEDDELLIHCDPISF